MIAAVEVIPGRYYDSVRLMQVTRSITGVPGVDCALVAMATELNLRLLGDMGFDPADAEGATPDDLVIAVQGPTAEAVAAGRAAAERALTGPGSGAPDPGGGFLAAPRPRTLGAAGRTGGANVALVSVPGPHAFVEAMDALRSGMHVMVFSNNVSLEHEVLLKEAAAQRGLLVMGPDCGTAVINGVGLGFANAVDLGPVAIVGASGTGIQQLCALLDASGVGVRHALGTGSRDLSAPVGGASTLAGLAALDVDPRVEVIVIVSKPPDPQVADEVRQAVAACRTPVVTALLGEAGVTLEAAATSTLESLGRTSAEPPAWIPEPALRSRRGWVRGLFCGGTLRDEAAAVLGPTLGAIALDPGAPGHRLVDYGADEFTRGRAHPMIDPGLRVEALAAAAADPTTGVILFDVVLGYGAHSDPGPQLAAVVADADVATPVVVSLCGTGRDPQGLTRQAEALRAAGAEVHVSNAAAARRVAELAGEPRL